ncbi:replication-relaxation family protein [Sporosarcina sp. GW1-11]|uniref:replication-relaxation family protein n=1 Tax=Sporosarcina sp. GW1-11 TaxID=2899126 RepID=UPI00294CC5D6|nr:replication-relaxation family protein [Sporosarcina sp. GW1-11]MDV6378225.1 replication-relaxation family protein [Sporosarcina sp. GW1-11]
MAYALGYSLAPKTERILKLLLCYRGMTAKQLAFIFFQTKQITLSQEKSIYNDLAKLKKQGLVKSLRLQQNVSSGSLYYLSQAGYDCTKDLLNIQNGQIATGWLPADYDEYDVADLSYDVYLPPLKQTAHHLLLIDFFSELHINSDELGETIAHRHNLYAARKHKTREGTIQYRPDAEIIINNSVFTVEIDRATESHEQLKQKFQTYKQYFETMANDSNNEIPAGILFIVESRRREQGIQRRWHNILSAFYSVLSDYSHRLNLILTTIDQAAETILFEREREFYKSKIKDHMKYYIEPNQRAHFLQKESNDEPLIVIVTDETNEYRLLLCDVAQEYESSIYRKRIHFYDRQLKGYKQKQFTIHNKNVIFKDYKTTIFYPKYKPLILDSFKTYKLDVNLTYKLTALSKTLDYHSFDSILNAPVTY